MSVFNLNSKIIQPNGWPYGWPFMRHIEQFPRRLTCLPLPSTLLGTSVIVETPVSAGPGLLTCLSMPSVSPDTLLEVRVLYDANGADESVNCLSGGTPTVSAQYSSYGAANTVDGNTNTYWRSAGSNPIWWKYDFGEGVSKGIRRLRVYTHNAYTIRDFIVQVSDNDSDWTDVYSGFFDPLANWQSVEFVNTAHRYFRLYVTSPAYFYVYEIELMESYPYIFAPFQEVGETHTVLGNDSLGFVRSGYVFNGWNTQADGGGTDYDPDDSFSLTAASAILYAKWTEEE